ncbi:uncharacterized protein LOC110102091 [Dendrobium catenatum]|uniref:uncharacterized protein LOC110102091 n=1 Tax=Dendrobium catenatum TaxID=906689 RepID=UPI0009F4774D|nr:uncharacterized protein LOC110102091 [Dendrobium catenatum]
MADPSLLTYQKEDIRMYMVIYVDDILLTGNSQTVVTKLLVNLHTRFQMKDLGSLNPFLGLQAVFTDYGVLLHQKQYAEKILNRAGMQETKPMAMPMSGKVTITAKSHEEFSNPQVYRQIIGALQYLTLTRPDIRFAVNQLSQSMHKPLNINFEALKRLLRYIKGTIDFGIPLYKNSLTLRSYVDADWASNTSDRKSISGYCNFLGKSLI